MPGKRTKRGKRTKPGKSKSRTPRETWTDDFCGPGFADIAIERVEFLELLHADDDIEGIQETISFFSSRVRAQGRKDWQAGTLEDFDWTYDHVSATSRDDGARTAWILIEDEWIPACTCQDSPECRHALALGLEITSDASEKVAPHSRPVRKEIASKPSGDSRNPDAVKTLRESPLFSLRRAALAEMIENSPIEEHLIYEINDKLTIEDPDLRCFAVAEACQSRGDWVPKGLRPYLKRKDLAHRAEEKLHAHVFDELQQWLNRSQITPKMTFRGILSLQHNYKSDAIVTLQMRVTSPKLRDAPRTSAQVAKSRMAHLDGSSPTSPDQFALLDWASHIRTEYTDSRNEVETLTVKQVLDLEHLNHSSLLAWADDIDSSLASLAGIHASSPVRFDSTLARLQPRCIQHDTDAAIELCFLLADGTTSKLGETLVFKSQSHSSETPLQSKEFAIVNGVIHPIATDVPIEIVELFKKLDTLRLDSERRPLMLQQLATSFPTIATDLQQHHTRLYRATPYITLDLREDDWLQVRLFAKPIASAWTPEDTALTPDLLEYTHTSGWTQVQASNSSPANDARVFDAITRETLAKDVDTTQPPSPQITEEPGRSTMAEEEIWLEAPEPADVATAVDWYEQFTSNSGNSARHVCESKDRNLGRWTRLGGKTIEVFADAWKRAPGDVQFYGTETIRKLLDGRRNVSPHITIESSGVDWLEISATWEMEGAHLSAEDIAALRKATTTFVKLPSGWARRDLLDIHDEATEVLADLAIEIGLPPTRLNTLTLAGAKGNTLDILDQLGADEENSAAIRQIRKSIEGFKGLPTIRTPRGFTGEMRPYQRHGLSFLAYVSRLGLGAVLADDMGLGKTVQTLAWLQWLRNREPKSGPTLIVCPASVAHNWVDESAQFAPKLSVLHLGPGKERQALMAEVPATDLIITTYTLARRDMDQWSEIKLRALVLDEAQAIKNPDAEITKALARINAKHRLALTGTPIENRLLDLWSIVNCVSPGYLGTRCDFATRFDNLNVTTDRRTFLSAKLRPILLRRTKAEVEPDLPDRIEEARWCEMTEGQKRLYLAELAKSRSLINQLAEDTDTLRKNKISILAALTRLRQICCHPALAGGKPSLGSGKFATFFELLEPLLEEGSKVLVFSQFVESLKLLRKDLIKRKIPTHVLTGRTTKRDVVVKRFNTDTQPCVFLISLKAGGTGLNLTTANKVILFDPWWNPAAESQAIDRSHRIGQDRTVIAYRLITEGTIEEKIRELQRRKEGLVRDVLGQDGFGRSLTRDDLDYLLQA